ncbi:hypothetical protein ACHAXR_010982 [Thalassiosira sp. AJA248-18]
MMCSALRVSKQQMREFVAGGKRSESNEPPSSSSSSSANEAIHSSNNDVGGRRGDGGQQAFPNNDNRARTKGFNGTRGKNNNIYQNSASIVGVGRNSSSGEESSAAVGGMKNNHPLHHQSTGANQQPARGVAAAAAMHPVVAGGENARPRRAGGPSRPLANPYSKQPPAVNPYSKQSSSTGSSNAEVSNRQPSSTTNNNNMMGGRMPSSELQTANNDNANNANNGMQNQNATQMQQHSYAPPKTPAAANQQRHGSQQQQRRKSCIRNPYATNTKTNASPHSAQHRQAATMQMQTNRSQQTSAESFSNIPRPNSSYQQRPSNNNTGSTGLSPPPPPPNQEHFQHPSRPATANAGAMAMPHNNNQQFHHSSEMRPSSSSRAAPNPTNFSVTSSTNNDDNNANKNNNLHRFFSSANPQQPQSPQRRQRQQQQQQQCQHSSSAAAATAAAAANRQPSPGRKKPSIGNRQGSLTSMGIQQISEPGPIPLCSSTSQNWIYPLDEKYPERRYQLEMSHAAIMQNTLVSLPTGLGKTLIAAVVMYNYYRWFPSGKVVFCAPTRPLVSQQIHACYKIMGIPEKHTAEISGRSKPASRDAMWLNKRVFFCTPQTLVKDIQERRCKAESIVCVVMDEAHRATGEHANSVLVRMIKASGAKFRLVGLSATPGTDIKSIQAVLETLNISRIEARTEDDPNVKQYIHNREEEVIVVKQPDVVKAIDNKFGQLIAPILSRLREERVSARLMYDSASLKHWSVMEAQKEYQARTKNYALGPQFMALGILCKSRQHLKEHGVQMARSKLAQDVSNPQNEGRIQFLTKQPIFQTLMRDMMVASGTRQDDEQGIGTAESSSDFLNNPKLTKLAEVLTEHFERKQAINESTRVIVFSQWRESVGEIVKMLSQNASLLKPAQFIGQARTKGNGNNKGKKGATSSNSGADTAGMNQAQQQRVLAQFSEGVYNVLVCTCVGEEGLDIGEVDLIVNFDVMKSPIRSIQRSGRTGRKRNGRVVFLVAEGQEERSYRQSVTNTNKIARALRNPAVFKLCPNPPMFPDEPNLMRKKMNVASFHLSQVGGHTPKTRKQNGKGGGAKKKRIQSKAIENNWRLDHAQEEERRSLFGQLPRSSCREYEYKSNEFPSSLKRKYLNSRRNLRKGKQTIAMGVGKSSTILQKLEKCYIRDNDGAREGLASVDEISDNVGSDAEKNPTESFISVGDCRSVNFGSDHSFGGDQSSESNRNHHNDSLDGIFGPIIEVERTPGSANPSQIACLFDAAHHKNCAVIAPPGLALDDSDEECESCESASGNSSNMSMNDDLCAFFEKNNQSDIRAESHENDDSFSMKTPFSDQGSDVIFGADADDNLEFGTPREIDVDHEVDTRTSNEVAEASKSLASTLVIDGGNDKVETRIGAVNEKENIDTQLLLSPIRKEKQPSSAEIEERRSHDRNDKKESVGFQFHLTLEDEKNDTTEVHVESFIQVNEEGAGCVDHSKHEEAQSPVVAFHLPTPPPSSDESDDDSQNSSMEHPNHDTALNAPQPIPGDVSKSNQFEIFDDVDVENNESEEAGNHAASFFQLPTQYSSSSEEDDDSAESNERPSDIGCATTYEAEMPANVTAASQNKQGNLKGQSLSSQRLASTSESRHVQFKPTSFHKMSAEDLTDTPIKASFSANAKSSGANLQIPLDSLTDTPLQCRKDIGQQRTSLESLTDTPLPRRKNVGQQRKSLDSLTDTPLPRHKNCGQQRKRLRTAPKIDASKKSEPGTTEKLDRVKKRVDEKYRCRFLDCEAVNDDSEESDEEDLEDEEMSHDSFINDTSQLGFTQDDLDRANADAEIEVCDHAEESVLHRQFDNQHNIDNQFKTPVFNRRMRTPASQSQHSNLSQKGLGKMNFIRSVLEHHRQGGDADQLEEEYHRLAGTNESHEANNGLDFDSPIQPKQPSHLELGSQSSTAGPTHANPGNSIQNELRPQQNITSAATRGVASAAAASNNQPVVLTAEQRARIEAKRAEALKRRQQRMQQKSAPFNPYAK